VGTESVFPPDRVTVMGVLNVTPDSFSDGGRLTSEASGTDTAKVLARAQQFAAAGAHVLDVGGESTRPGAASVSAKEEVARTVGAIAALQQSLDLPISIDTRKASVARAALEAGARVVNDVSGLSFDADLPRVVADYDATLIVGHTRGTPDIMQRSVRYHDVLAEVATELEASVEKALAAGVVRERLVVDPGIGFGKDLDANLELIVHLDWLKGRLELPVLVGPSRKSFLGHITGDPVGDREAATQAACAIAVFNGADGVRVHDVAGAMRSVAVGRAFRAARRKELS
jgi:dihydropteroate synthase